MSDALDKTGAVSSKKAARFVEGVCAWGLFTFLIHGLTRDGMGPVTLFVTLAVVIAVFISLMVLRRRLSTDAFRFWWVLFALAAAFGFFRLFLYVGLIAWPLNFATDTPTYLRLLYSHVVFTLTVAAALVWAIVPWDGQKKNHFIAWGQWGRGFGTVLLILSSVGMWIWAVSHVWGKHPATTGNYGVLLLIALAKACLTGVTEEACYRGVIQPAAITRFGVVGGILCQAGLYAAFHMHLGAALVGEMFFVACVFVLGLLFGAVTYRNKGIGWAAAVHAALNLMIEWDNIS